MTGSSQMKNSMPSLQECTFCGKTDLKRTHENVYHPFKKDHGPFEFYMCRTCGSGLTLEPPSTEALTALYTSYKDGLPDLHREIMREDPQHDLYELCARRMLRRHGPTNSPTWVDVGAGGGELSKILAKLLPLGSGTAIDLHARPAQLDSAPSVKWIQADINQSGFTDAAGLANTADFVISTAVWEHVLYPDVYAKDLIRLLKPGGVLYLMCPNYGSFARRLMGQGWPYFTPGEHLNMPTPKGAMLCLARQWTAIHGAAGQKPVVQSRALALPYSFRYVLRRFGIDFLGKLVPPGLGLPLPAGALEAVLVAPDTARV